MHGATPAQLTFLEGELARFVESGAWEFGTCRKWVSRLFLVPKPGVNQWRCIIDLRVLNSYRVRKRLKMETLHGVRHLTQKGDYMFSFDLQDGFYVVGIAEADRDYLTVDVRDKLNRLSRQATRLIARATRNARELPVRELQSLAGLAQYLFLAIFMRELHSVVGDRWGGRVRMTPQLRRDLQWWTSVPSQSNGKPIHRPSSADERQHITWKELKAVRLAVESFLPHLAGRNVLLHEDNKAKLKQSGAAATAVAPRWEGKAWHHALTEMAVEELTVAPRAGLFRPGRRDVRDGWAPAIAPSYASCMKQYFRFREEERRPALAADPGTMARYVTWLGNLGTIKASSLQPYLSAVNNFFKDHGREPMALGDPVGRVRKGLAASHVTLHPELLRAPLPARVGATTAAYVICVTMQKIKYIGGWAMESSVVLDYVDPTLLPCPTAWHLFGWMTPWGGQPARLPRQVAT
eukprot:jgi/Tetstr1/421449/TSEL_012398.t1